MFHVGAASGIALLAVCFRRTYLLRACLAVVVVVAVVVINSG